MTPWPYPFWIAHRGAGRLAPENTLTAFRLGASHGYRMFECDVKLSADEVPFLMHDATLERTTDGHGIGGEHSWRELSQLDAGSWHSRTHAGEPLASLANVARFCQSNHCQLNIEIKPTPGAETLTGERVAQDAEPGLPRGLLLDSLRADWLDTARALQCLAVVFNSALWDATTMAQARSAGLHTLAYTVNDEWEAARLRALGIDGLITDRVDRFAPASA